MSTQKTLSQKATRESQAYVLLELILMAKQDVTEGRTHSAEDALQRLRKSRG
ncbi:hypothetical protein R6Y99_16135 [Pseudomonas lundensis]|uniref:hypothetical protein n=1 Tax=Serratia proteamaculans TaxID=28151 RepID=UPI002980D8FD|nr:hypothetical protein [Serratia proteamaculans]MDW5501322.1 hypothetical protein [Serratia proteamaculans]MDW5506386.1 hypothetical protein [Pseudomonas lundensis]